MFACLRFKKWIIPAFLFCCLPVPPPAVMAAAVPPALKLAADFRDDLPLNEYLVSEKYDGVRAYWDGSRLISRAGNRFEAPPWFTRSFPPVPLDGELWLARGQFERLSGIVRRQNDPQGWREVHYMVFDLPQAAGGFADRYRQLQKLLAKSPAEHLQLVEQQPVTDRPTLMRRLDEVIAGGGEGLMLQRRDAVYRGGRSNDLVKLKAWRDAEATVIAHLPGKGKYQGLLGALLVRLENGKEFRIGSGFSDAQRQYPPAIGSRITYKYTGLSQRGIPRFASFLRVRENY
ncbi:MAG: DNA ligase [Gammaproteobacteria bacterium]|nr:DNA ligase [Gammaproteobacteria bacterium]